MLPCFDKENERLKKLYSLNILDTKPNSAFDRITNLAARRFKVPISLISLIDKDRQWFKSHHGFDLSQTSRKASFCNKATKRKDICIVSDALTDDLFRKVATHPTYVKPLRFYAGIPLITKDGYHIGSFSVADYTPNHNFSDEDKKDLQTMADMVINLIENNPQIT